MRHKFNHCGALPPPGYLGACSCPRGHWPRTPHHSDGGTTWRVTVLDLVTAKQAIDRTLDRLQSRRNGLSYSGECRRYCASLAAFNRLATHAPSHIFASFEAQYPNWSGR